MPGSVLCALDAVITLTLRRSVVSPLLTAHKEHQSYTRHSNRRASKGQEHNVETGHGPRYKGTWG